MYINNRDRLYIERVYTKQYLIISTFEQRYVQVNILTNHQKYLLLYIAFRLDKQNILFRYQEQILNVNWFKYVLSQDYVSRILNHLLIMI
jgi:hypothetical protein